MKKLIAALLAGTMLCMSLTACGGTTDNGGTTGDETPHTHTFEEGWTWDETDHWHKATCEHQNEVSEKNAHTMSDGKCSVCGYEEKKKSSLTEDTDFLALVSDRVTEEEWKAIYSPENFKNVTVRDTRGDIEGKDDQRIKMFIDCSDTQLSLDGYYRRWGWAIIPTTEGERKNISGFILENGVLRNYVNQGSTIYYTQEELTQEDLGNGQFVTKDGQYSFLYALLIAADLSDYFNDFTYDENLGAYVYEAPEDSDDTKNGIWVDFMAFDGMGARLTYVELKFKEGRLALIHTRCDGYSTDYYDCYYDYGTTKVVVPEDAVLVES